MKKLLGKNWKTTLLGVADWIFGGLAVAWYVFSLPELKIALFVFGALYLICSGLSKILTKDHDVDNNAVADDIGGGGIPNKPPKE